MPTGKKRRRRLARRRLSRHDRNEKFNPAFNANLRRKQRPGLPKLKRD